VFAAAIVGGSPFCVLPACVPVWMNQSRQPLPAAQVAASLSGEVKGTVDRITGGRQQ
jgi:hypothetical protein